MWPAAVAMWPAAEDVLATHGKERIDGANLSPWPSYGSPVRARKPSSAELLRHSFVSGLAGAGSLGRFRSTTTATVSPQNDHADEFYAKQVILCSSAGALPVIQSARRAAFVFQIASPGMARSPCAVAWADALAGSRGLVPVRKPGSWDGGPGLDVTLRTVQHAGIRVEGRLRN